MARLLALPPSQGFAVLRHLNESSITVLSGDVQAVDVLADIPLAGKEVIAMVPFRQIRERGFEAIDDGSPLLVLVADKKEVLDTAAFVDALPESLPQIDDLGFSLSDEEYAQRATTVIRNEIGRGEGANFVIRRDYRAKTKEPPRQAILAWLRRLLERESGAYWTFAFCTPEICAVGATPERHVSVEQGTVMMNPISGTLRHGDHVPTTSELLAFLQDRKESEELVMVVDEELKMMSAVCPEGGVMRGPFLKPMSRLTHTEYLLEGRSKLDPREILRLTMFAPTVTGSPMENACRVIARHEDTGRGYYSGVLAHFAPTATGYDLHASILIRTAFLTPSGDITVSAGATLVRHSDAMSEAKETHAKASGVLGALGIGRSKTQGEPMPRPALNTAVDDPQVAQALTDRNRHLAPFWRDEQTVVATFDAQVLVVDCEDEFTTMLAHQLRRLGMDVKILPWDEVENVLDWDLVVFGPGPGDPLSSGDPRIARVRSLISERMGRPMVAVCLSHQILASMSGLEIRQLPVPRQGQPLDVEILGKNSRIGFYNTFTAVGADGSRTPLWNLRVHSEPDTGFVHLLTGENVVSVQGHLESVLSYDGFGALTRVVAHVLS